MTAPWPTMLPEAVYDMLAGGAGEVSTVAVGGAWQGQAIESLAHAAISEANTAATAPGWMGLGGAASAQTVTDINGVLSALSSGWAEPKVVAAETAAAAYRSAVEGMFPSPVCTQNRIEQASDVAINPSVWFTLTPDIVRLDSTYFGVYWQTNSALAMGYTTTLAGLLSTLAVPPPVGPLAVSPGRACGSS